MNLNLDNYIDDKDVYKTLQLHRFAENKRTVLKHHDVDSMYFDECRQRELSAYKALLFFYAYLNEKEN